MSYDFALLGFSLIALASSKAIAAEPGSVEILNFAFHPTEIAVAVGSKLTFVNHDHVPHSIVGEASGKEMFRSAEQIDEDESFTVMLDKPGDIWVRCGLHSNMKSRVTVTP